MTPSSPAATREAFSAYQARAAAVFGDAPPGSFAKFGGRLVRRLDATEFAERHAAYRLAREAFDRRLANGDTLDDATMQELAEQAAALLLPRPDQPAGGA